MTTPDLSDPAIMQHIKAVQDGSERWMCLGYVPKTNNKIKFYECGNGGLDELREELSDSSIRYAYIRYEINNLPKFCYIAWCGDGVNGPIKGSFSGHAIEIAKILKPVHHQLNARNEDDVDEKAIIGALTKATGASYDSGAKVQGSSKAQVPTSVSQGRVAATQSNITQKTFDKSDYNKKDESAQYWKSNSAPATKEPARPDRSDYNITTERENYWKENASEPKPAPTSTSSTAAPTRTVTNRFQQMAAPQQTEPVKPPPPRATGNVASRFQPQQQAPTPAPVSKPTPPKPAPKPPVAARQPEPEPEPVYEQQEEQQYDQGYDQQDQQYDQGGYDDSQQQYDDQQQYDESQQQYDQGYEQQDQQYDQGGYDQQEQQYDDSQQQYDQGGYDQQEQQYDDSQQQYDQGYDQQEQQYDQGGDYPIATALYAYQGENEGDLSFAEGDQIKVLDQSDPSGWWQGELNGAVGFFPKNFVQL